MIEARLNKDGSLDEIVGKGCSVHLEQMEKNVWWMEIDDGENRIHVWLRKDGGAFHRENDCPSLVVKT